MMSVLSEHMDKKRAWNFLPNQAYQFWLGEKLHARVVVYQTSTARTESEFHAMPDNDFVIVQKLR